jgi:predicted flap endonuclease-1-like 5' DNA nuclease
MRFVIWELIVPLIIALGLGLVLGWGLWRWRHTKVTSIEWQSVLAESSARQSRLRELENLLGEREREVVALQADTTDDALASEFEKGIAELQASLTEVEQQRDAALAKATELEARPERIHQTAQFAARATYKAEDLRQIKGIGPKLEKLLNDVGITTLAQLAALDESGVSDLQSHLEQFPGRVEREEWVAQAKNLISS